MQSGLSHATRLRFARALPVVAVLVPLSILGVVGWLTWTTVWDDARGEMRRAAAAVAEYGKRALESYSVSAARVNDRLRNLSDPSIRANEETLHRDLKRMAVDLSQSELAYAIDRHGFPLVSSNLYPVPRGVSLRDRDYFKALSVDSAPEVYVSTTFVGRFDGQLLFSVARRRHDTGNPAQKDGFDGVVLVSISPNTLADGMRRLLPEAGDRMALVRADGYGISTTGGSEDLTQPLPRVDPSSPFHDYAAKGAEAAIYLSTTAMPGETSLLAMQRIAGFPIYAVSIRSRTEIVARWWRLMESQLAFGLPATIGLFLLSLQVWHDQRRLAQSNAALRRDNDLSIDRLDRAKRFGLVGTFEFDLRTGVSRRSPEYMSVHGFAPLAAEETHDDWARRIHPDDRNRAETEVLRALSDESGTTDYGQTYRIITRAGDVRWIAARGEIIRDEMGKAIRLLGAHVDVTPLRTTELALSESDARLRLAQEALGIGTWEWTRSPRSFSCSSKLSELCGVNTRERAVGLQDVLSRIHRDDRRTLYGLIAAAQDTGVLAMDLRLDRAPAGQTSEIVWLALRATSTQAGGARLMGIAYDITERKRSEEFTRLVAHEVEHRAKNNLAVVSGLLRMTKADSVSDLVAVLDGRIKALAGTIGLLSQSHWTGADLEDLIRTALAPFEHGVAGQSSAIALSGPAVVIDVDAAQPLSMALHELATNAAKYGALSVPKGRLEISWRVESEVRICWKERGGPPLQGPPPKTGFGSKLIAMLFEGQIGGVVKKTWTPDGLVCELSFDTGKTRRLPEG